MKQFIETITKRIQVWHEVRARRMERARQLRLDREARKAVQITELYGILYICVHGVPLFASADLAQDLFKSVAQARSNYMNWKEEKIWEK